MGNTKPATCILIPATAAAHGASAPRAPAAAARRRSPALRSFVVRARTSPPPPLGDMPFIDGAPWPSVDPWLDGMPFIDGQVVSTASAMGINHWVDQE